MAKTACIECVRPVHVCSFASTGLLCHFEAMPFISTNTGDKFRTMAELSKRSEKEKTVKSGAGHATLSVIASPVNAAEPPAVTEVREIRVGDFCLDRDV